MVRGREKDREIITNKMERDESEREITQNQNGGRRRGESDKEIMQNGETIEKRVIEK